MISKGVITCNLTFQQLSEYIPIIGQSVGEVEFLALGIDDIAEMHNNWRVV